MIEFKTVTKQDKIGYLFNEDIVGQKEVVMYRTRKPLFTFGGFTVLGAGWGEWLEVDQKKEWF